MSSLILRATQVYWACTPDADGEQPTANAAVITATIALDLSCHVSAHPAAGMING
ncbi:hypothetical protein ACFVYE_29680 [Streptomyces sp. NPDC058239]|uniref:hypothetical protein n=1 Tax=unclassified Streptomyces TaxID=2593676 RepID=UPI00365AEB74